MNRSRKALTMTLSWMLDEDDADVDLPPPSPLLLSPSTPVHHPLMIQHLSHLRWPIRAVLSAYDVFSQNV
jgi:hypothetical protein